MSRENMLLEPGVLSALILLSTAGTLLISGCSGERSAEVGRGHALPIQWSLSAEPTIILGGVGGVGLEMFEGVVGAAWTSDGSILVADAGPDEVRRFGSDGSPLGAMGRRGSGPGEFGNLWGVFPGPGDTIWAYDQNRRIIGFFEGEYQRDLEIYRGEPVGWIGDQVIAAGIPPLHRGRQPRSPGLHRDPWRIVAHAADGSGADTLVRGLSEESFLSEDLIWGRPVFDRGPHLALGSDFVAYGDGGSNEVVVVDMTGDTLARITVPQISGSDLDELATARRKARIEGFPLERRPRDRAFVSAIPVPEWIAGISDLVVDAEDHIWIRGVFWPTDSLATWSVYDRDGTKVAWINTPARITVREIGEDKLLATDRDSFDVFRLLIYGLQK